MTLRGVLVLFGVVILLEIADDFDTEHFLAWEDIVRAALTLTALELYRRYYPDYPGGIKNKDNHDK